MYSNKIFIFLLLIFLSFASYSQVNTEKYLNRIDSLNNLLKKSRKGQQPAIYKQISEIYLQLTEDNNFKNDETFGKIEDNINSILSYAQTQKDEYYLGIAYRLFGRLNERKDSITIAISYYEKAAKEFIVIDSINLLAQTYNDHGILLFNNNEFGKAIELCDSVLSLDRNLVDNDFIGESYYTKGVAYAYTSDYPNAVKTFKEMLAYGTEIKDTASISTCLNSLGNIEFFQGNTVPALNYFIESLKIHEAKKEEKEANVRKVNIGNVLKDMSQFDQALKYYNDALTYFQSKNTDEAKEYAADCLNNIGIIYNNQKKYDEAEGYYEDALKLSQEIRDSGKLMMTYINLGFTQTDKKELHQAKQSYQRALRIANALGDLKRIALIYGNLGDIYQSENNPNEAINYYNNSLNIALELGVKEIQKQDYEGLSNSYESLNDPVKALKYFKQYSSVKDSLLNESNQRAVAQMKEQFESDKKDKENQLLKSNNTVLELQGKRDQIVKIGMGFIITLILVFTVVVFRQLQEKKRKNILLAEQKEEIETQRDEIMAQKDLLAKQKQEITDSIYYARRIQRAVLPPEQASSDILPEHFILFKPRDIVSGDFYWMTKRDNKTVLVDADCTGHGVPGAFMSMLGVAFLNEIVSSCEQLQADLILNELRNYVKTTLGQKGKQDEAKDGMDIALCIIDWETNKMQYAGAYNPLYYFKNGVFNEIKADKMPIGVYVKDQTPFTNNIVEFEKGDTFYIFSDGYVSQFGGTDGRKFMTKPFKALLETIQNKSMAEQMKILDEALLEWQGNFEQVDDISVIGFRF